MPVEYTHKLVDGDYKIYRNDEHVATYDPVTEDVTYTHGDDKYAGPIGREVAKIQKSGQDVEEPALPATTPPVAAPPAPKKPKELTALELLEARVAAIEERLTIELPKIPLNVRKTRDRFEDHVDLTDAPVCDPHLGDLTPEFVEWARNGGMTREVFRKRYYSRIKNLCHKDDPEEG